jgi:hypothetical protein
MPLVTVSVHALSCGHFTLPEHQFVHPVSGDARKSVPSLVFLIEHHHYITAKVTRVLFDLGLRKDTKRYPSPIQKHIKTRQPMITEPDIIENLSKGGLGPDDIDLIIYSHVRVQGRSSYIWLRNKCRYIGITSANLAAFLRQSSL